MTMWMDLTNSLVTWKGGVVGIIRAELEIAKHLHVIDSNIKFSICTDNGFKEVKTEELEWLWKSDSVGDAYLKYFQREKHVQKVQRGQLRSEYPALNNAFLMSDSRLIRFKEAVKQFILALPKPLDTALFYPAKLIYKIIKKAKKSKDGLSDKKSMTTKKEIECPYNDNDTIFSCGWIASEKESCFSKIKEKQKLNIIYLIYDIIVIKQGLKHFYSSDNERFKRYLFWVSNNCDKIIYGGHTAQIDTESYFKSNNWNVPEGDFVKFGSDIYHPVEEAEDCDVLKKYNIRGEFILTVGSIEPRKNIKTLYRAYCIMLKKYSLSQVPTLVIIGKNISEHDLTEKINKTPFVNEKIIMITPMDNELDFLYKKSKFILVPSLYEGWSLTLPEGLNYGKLCICSDVAPLKEIAQDVAVFISPLDANLWAETIMDFALNNSKIELQENVVKTKWRPTSWHETTEKVYNVASGIAKTDKNNTTYTLFYDVTTLWYAARSESSVSGILRTQLILLRYISRVHKNIRYFALTPRGYIEFSKSDLQELLCDEPIDQSFKNIQKEIANNDLNVNSNLDAFNYISVKDRFATSFWLFCSILPDEFQKKLVKFAKDKYHAKDKNIDYTVPFAKGDIVLSVGAGFDNNSYKVLLKKHEEMNFSYIQLIYDYTPILIPQTHREDTVEAYYSFLKYINLLSDVIFFGGKTAMRDGIRYQKSQKQVIRPSHVVKFGSNIIGEAPNEEVIRKVLEKYCLLGDFILTVGSIEARKNHEILYDAYVTLLDRGIKSLPKLVICGYPGWKTTDFVSRLALDERTKNYIILDSFSDSELDVLYRTCLFTVLPSLYEGWSLTLPEALNYGKFCIASDVDPLKEIGQDFIEYANPYDVKEWADKILYYAFNKNILKDKERKIHDKWHSITWEECARKIVDSLDQLAVHGVESFTEGAEFQNE